MTNKYKNYRKYDDLREALREQGKLDQRKYYIHKIPGIEPHRKRVYRYYKSRVNLKELTCSCDEFSELEQLYSHPRDIRRMCRHLAAVLINKTETDSLTKLLLETRRKFGAEKLLRKKVKGRTIVIGFKNIAVDDWINVYIEGMERDGQFFKYAYNPDEKRWAFGTGPRDKLNVESFLKNQIKLLS